MSSSTLFTLFAATFAATVLSAHVLQKGQDCTHRPNECAPGLACDGRGSRKRCIVFKQAGMECSLNEPFWLCQPGLTCQDSTCRIPRDGVCTNNRDDCVTGLSCDGRGSTKRCILYQQAGDECRINSPFSICQRGLTCDREVCRVPVGGACRFFPTKCVTGAACDGRRCVIFPRDLGETCTRTLKCKTGFVCDGQCKLPKKAPCDRSPTQCVSGTICSGTRLRKLCSPVRGAGHRCSVVGFLPCEAGLSCVGNVCVRGNVPKGDRCRGTHEVCKSGLVCGGPPHNRICVTPMQKGQFCRSDPYWKCADGLRCLNRYCVEY